MPKAFPIEGTEVRIRRHGAAVILERIPCDWSWLGAVTGLVHEDFQQAVAEKPVAEHGSDPDRPFE